MDSVRATDDASRAVQKTPQRVALDTMLEKIITEEYIYTEAVPHMTICLLVTENGYSILGKSVPADPENYNVDLGMKFAKEDCIRQLWPLEAYLLREVMTESGTLKTE